MVDVTALSFEEILVPGGDEIWEELGALVDDGNSIEFSVFAVEMIEAVDEEEDDNALAVVGDKLEGL